MSFFVKAMPFLYTVPCQLLHHFFLHTCTSLLVVQADSQDYYISFMHYKSSPEPDNKRSILYNVAGTITDANLIETLMKHINIIINYNPWFCHKNF